MELSIVTVTWNSEAHVRELMASVFAGAKKTSFELIIVDNASTDHTIAHVTSVDREVHVIANQTNRGFSVANNQGAAVAKGEFILFLNPDMRIAPDSLDVIVPWMRAHPEIGIAGCKLTNEDGSINLRATPRRFPKLWEQIAVVLKIPKVFPHLLDTYLMREIDFATSPKRDVDTVQGSFFLMRRTLYQQRGFAFDPRFFIWFEDVDACRDAVKRGWKVMWTPLISCVDIGGQSFKKRKMWWKQWQYAKSMMTYFFKWDIANRTRIKRIERI